MKRFFKILSAKKEKTKQKSVDYYQVSLEKFGRAQMMTLAKKGLSIQFRSN